ncbi:MAG TPA: hypothetical protein VFN74_13115, partial [Chloroflexota bacterium]|nr:hypothetical protein [Chloroflexota bacterium]
EVCFRCVDAGAAAFARQRPRIAPLDAPAAALAVALTGVLAADTVRMTPVFLSYMDVALGLAGPDAYRAAVAVLPVLATLLTGAAVVLVGRLGGGARHAAAALVPVALAVQLGLSVQHLAGSGWPTLQGLLIEALPLPWDGHLPPTDAYTVVPWLKVVQLALIGAAAALALRRSAFPRRLAAGGAAASFGGLFALPMSLAC